MHWTRAAVGLGVALGPLGLAVHIAAQPPAAPVELKPQQAPAFRQIGAYFFNGQNETQVWINVEPQHVDGGADPIVFNVTMKFPGRRLDHAPETVELRPQVRCVPAVYLARARLPVFKLTIDDAPTIDLSPNGQTSFFLPTCGGGRGSVTFDTVSTQVPFAMLRRLASAASVKMDAIGFAVRLRPEDFAALQMFVLTIEHGVVIPG